MKLSLLFPPLLANQSQPHGCASFRLKQLQGSYPNRPAGQQTDAQARKHADKPSPGQEASEQTRKQAGQAGRTARRQATGEQTSRTRNKPTGKSPQEGVYLVLPMAARVSADPGVCLTNQHTGKSPPKKTVAVPKGSPSIRRPRNLPHKPACREVPQKRTETPPKAARVSADPGTAQAFADPGVYLRDQHTGKSPNKKKNRYQKAARISADPAICLRGRKSKKNRPRRDSDPA